MTTQIQRRRGTTAQHSTFTGAEAELTVDTTKDTVVVHDGATTGGRPLLREDQANLPTSVTNGISVPSSNNVAISTNGTGRLFVDASGRVGLGVTTPGTTLDLGSGTLRIRNAPGDSNGLQIYQDTSDVSRIYNFYPGPIAFGTNNTERMRLDSSGRLGLGTSSPGSLLSVKTTGGADLFYVDDNTSKFYFSPNGSGEGIIKLDTANAIRFLNAGGERLRISSSGNVGIGTTSPTHQLTVHSASTTSGTVEANRFSVRDNYGSATGLGNGFISPSSNNLAIVTNSTERMRIDSSGRLLVGTSISPSLTAGQYAKIHLVGNTFTADGDSVFNLGRGVLASSGLAAGISLGTLQFTDSAGAAHATINGQTDGVTGVNDYPGRLVFSTTADGASSPTERMRITSTGQVRLAGAGITFNGDTAAANELNDYEEGTWTPILADAETGGNTAASYTVNDGTYTKIGNVVRANCTFTFPVTTGMTAGNQAYIRGLPFTSSSIQQAQGAVYLRDITFSAGTTFASAWVNTSKTTAQIILQGSGVSETTMLVSQVASGTALIRFTLIYQV